MVAWSLLGSIGAGALFAADAELDKNSPFLPPGYGVQPTTPVKPPPTSSGPLSRELEFRGLIQLSGTYQFSLFNKKENKGYWISENESQEGLRVVSFDTDAMTVTVTMDGRTERLSLVSASDTPLPVQSSGPSAPQVNDRTPKPVLPPDLRNPSDQTNTRRVIPRRRVILPKK